MTTHKYEDIHWITLDTVRQYLFGRIGTPLQQAIEQASQSQSATIRHLKMAQNTLDAWSALVHWKRNPESIKSEFQDVDLHHLPEWLNHHLENLSPIKHEQERNIRVHPATFYEAIQLLATIAQCAGKMAHVMVSDASTPREGVWMRMVFTPNVANQYQSKLTIMDNLTDRLGQEIPLQFALLADLLEINQTRFSLQNNTRTGHQALAVLLPESRGVVTINAPSSPVVEATEDNPTAESTEAPTPAPESASTTPSEAEAPATTTTPAAEQQTVTPELSSVEAPTPPGDTAPSTDRPSSEAETATPTPAADKPKDTVVAIDEPSSDEQATNPLPAVVLYEKAEEIDQTDDLLARVQDILLDYIGTKDVLSRANEIVAKIFAVLKAEAAKKADNVVDKNKLDQLYAIMNTSPENIEKNGQAAQPASERARDILAALQALLMEPLNTPNGSSDSGSAKHESRDEIVANVEAASDEPSQDPSVRQSAESSGIN